MRLAKTVAVLAATTLLAGCGGGSGNDNGIQKLSAAKALAKMQADLSTVKSVHVVGEIDSSGKTLALDIHVGKGKGEGTITISGGKLDVRILDGNAYVRGSQQALVATGAPSVGASLAADKWIKGSAQTGSLAVFSQFLDIDQLRTALLKPSGTVTTGGTTTINGVKTFELVDTASTEGGTLYVAETGKALPVRLQRTGGGGRVDFTDYDATISVSVPPGAVDISKLGQ